MADEQLVHHVLGTLGHIDHGKTTLVKALTGIDADRLPEEKNRGLTIDLGFANVEIKPGFRLGLLDVPGHAKFLKNMIAGADGMDLALLVVAADDGVMPQTREQFEIIKLLGVQTGLVAITKCDAVDLEMRELVAADVADMVQGSFLETAPVHFVSGLTGEGIEELKEALMALVDTLPQKGAVGPFFMPVQRVFSPKGHGAVLTGIPASGAVALGDEVEVFPLGLRGKIKGIQAYFKDRAQAQAGHSTALNISGIDYKDCQRGCVVGTPGVFGPALHVSVRLMVLKSLGRTLKEGLVVRLHVGTQEVMSSLRLLEGKVLEGGDTALVQLCLEEPVVVRPGQPFVLRVHSPMQLIGGGRVLSSDSVRVKRKDATHIEKLLAVEKALDDPQALLLQAALDAGGPVAKDELARRCGISTGEAQKLIEHLVQSKQLQTVGHEGKVLHPKGQQKLAQEVCAALDRFHKEHPLLWGSPKSELASKLKLPRPVFGEVLLQLESTQQIKIKGEQLALADFEVTLSEAQQKLSVALEETHLQNPYKPPRFEELGEKVKAPKEDWEPVYWHLVDTQKLLPLTEKFAFHAQAVADAWQLAKADMAGGQVLQSPAYKTKLGTSIKYAYALCDYFDEKGWTKRVADGRVLSE